ncbi:hypothetical protein XA68_16174 [Ophiocordyceps unilateralis]|uniref:Rhodopsin domain-containing protein n=1 Tax=Ophiocordyceps unilateralis TaxID=268505 RepID=A0A2A9P745_OPHUN|nr:hypothetical protein XA68_16174 [Ophiocordyceps unilateralis]
MWLLLLYMTASMTLKLSILTLYLRLFQPVRHITWMVRIGFAIIVPFYTACVTGVLALCLPRVASHGGAWPSPEVVRLLHCIGRCSIICKVLSVFNSVSDAYLLFIPLHLIRDLNMSRRKKIGVVAVFLTGSIACITSIIGAVFRMIQGHDFGWEIIPTTLALNSEMTIGFVCSCVPVVFVLFKGSINSLSEASSSMFGRGRGRNDDQKTPGQPRGKVLS